MTMLDLGPATGRLARLVRHVTDDQLTAATPCEAYRLGDLLDHVDGLSQAFRAVADKEFGPFTDAAPAPDAARLGADWRTRIPAHLEALAAAWRNPAAWDGMTRAAGVELPGHIAGTIALNEVVIHSWDVARSTGQEFQCDPEALAACLEWLELLAAPEEQAGRQGMFGPVVDVGPRAPAVNRAIGLSGRDPGWRAPQEPPTG
jgi:uncharacterized protein (TIGR03086 family)